MSINNLVMMLNHSLYQMNNNLSADSTREDLAINTSFIEKEDLLTPIEWVIPITVVYGIIFVFGLVGNIFTCVVIARNKSLHTVTNYYLFSIAISDLLLLISGLPPEMYRIWSPETYVFGEAFCILQSFAAETSANATVLTITAFTVERYLAICHPFLSHTMSNLSRAVKYILAIWVCALCLAAPQAIQFGVVIEAKNGVEQSQCTVVANEFFQHAFKISTFMIFVGPMTLITVLYIMIAIKLNKSRMLQNHKQHRASFATHATCSATDVVGKNSRKAQAQNRVIKMLVAVVVAFFICWAPFHAQRLLAVYLNTASQEAQNMCIDFYNALTYISGVLYFLSTTVNPILYHIMSNKFRQAFKNTFYGLCKREVSEKRQRTYSVLSRCGPSIRNHQRSLSDGVQTCAGEEQLYMMDLHKDSPTINGRRIGHAISQSNGHKQTPRTLVKQSSSEDTHPKILSQSSNTTILTTISNTLPADKTFQPQLMPLKERQANDNNRYFVRIFKLFTNNDDLSKQRDRGITALDPDVTSKMLDTKDDISNSSLQDCDDIEYSSTDLMKYMEEVNEDLNTGT